MKILSALLVLMLTGSLCAQNTSLALKAGWSGSNRIIAESPFAAKSELTFQDPSMVHGLAVGLEGRMDFNARFYATAGLQYVQKGFRTSVPMPDLTIVDGRERLHYLTVPLAAGVRLFKGLSLQAGVETGVLLKARTELPDRSFDSEEFFDLYQEFDAGLLLGLEYAFGEHFFVQVRGVQGLIPLFDGELTDENGNSTPFEMYNRNLQVFAGYRF